MRVSSKKTRKPQPYIGLGLCASPSTPPYPAYFDTDDCIMEAANGASASQPHNGNGEENAGGYKLKFCTVCASNNNR